jgi:tetratricopeptide (TPR) repeat protein
MRRRAVARDAAFSFVRNAMHPIRLVLPFALLGLTACPDKDKSPAPVASAATVSSAAPVPLATIAPAQPKPLRGRPRSDKEMGTTSGNIYMGNLDAQILGVTKLVEKDPKEPSKLGTLSSLHYTRGRFKGDLDEIQLAIDETNTLIRQKPDEPGNYLARAQEEQSLHRFKEARADVEKAKALKADAATYAPLVADLDWNDGRYETAIVALRALREKSATYGTLIREGQLEHDLGDQKKADAAFEAAEDYIYDHPDTAAIPVAVLNLQRGMHKFSTGQFEDAVVFYREAITRVNTYIAANEHLAEVLHLMKKDDEAITLYENVIKLTPDPEFKGALAALYREHGKVKEANDLRAKAKAGYEELLKKYPEAMYWHASEFYMGSEGNDPKRALSLLRKNLELRPNSVSYTALARAQLANGDVPGAKESIDKALAMPVKSGELFWTAARVYTLLKDDAKAKSLASDAKAFNPRIEDTQPALGK